MGLGGRPALCTYQQILRARLGRRDLWVYIYQRDDKSQAGRDDWDENSRDAQLLKSGMQSRDDKPGMRDDRFSGLHTAGMQT